MPMPQDLYYQLNRVFADVRDAEKEAAKLEHEAQEIRDRSVRFMQVTYNAHYS